MCDHAGVCPAGWRNLLRCVGWRNLLRCRIKAQHVWPWTSTAHRCQLSTQWCLGTSRFFLIEQNTSCKIFSRLPASRNKYSKAIKPIFNLDHASINLWQYNWSQADVQSIECRCSNCLVKCTSAQDCTTKWRKHDHWMIAWKMEISDWYTSGQVIFFFILSRYVCGQVKLQCAKWLSIDSFPDRLKFVRNEDVCA